VEDGGIDGSEATASGAADLLFNGGNKDERAAAARGTLRRGGGIPKLMRASNAPIEQSVKAIEAGRKNAGLRRLGFVRHG